MFKNEFDCIYCHSENVSLSMDIRIKVDQTDYLDTRKSVFQKKTTEIYSIINGSDTKIECRDCGKSRTLKRKKEKNVK